MLSVNSKLEGYSLRVISLIFAVTNITLSSPPPVLVLRERGQKIVKH